MKILKADQIRSWDQYTIAHEPIASIDLMERAATKCFEWLDHNGWFVHSFAVFCGKGNNGGDGLAIARMLAVGGCKVSVYILEFGHRGTEDFQTNLAKLHLYPSVDIHFIQDENNFHSLEKETVVIDALFGSGLTRPPDGITSSLIDHLNNSGCTIIAIDVPSGMSVDQSSRGNKIIRANHTLSFQCYKLAFLVAENAAFIGEVIILDIGLLPEFLSSPDSNFELIDRSIIRSIYKPRNRFAHKGNFGHAIIIAGSYGKTGAAVLSAKACLRSGVGLLTCLIPKCGYEILQTSVSEAMVMTDANSSIITKIVPGTPSGNDDVLKYDSIGIGPGLGTASETRTALKELLSNYKKPIVLDADALNGLSLEKKLPSLPPGSVLTPHPKEFERLFGQCNSDFERIEKALQNARLLNCSIVLKGHHTFIATASGKGYFNNTGNAGMATAGSGDVLTGMITGLLAQEYSSEDASILAVHLHGLAGDIAAKEFSKEAMIAGDIIDNIGKAFKQLET